MTKLCKDCKHGRPNLGFSNGEARYEWNTFSMCLSPNLGVNPVNGEQESMRCAMLRELDYPCGPQGDWWEAKP